MWLVDHSFFVQYKEKAQIACAVQWTVCSVGHQEHIKSTRSGSSGRHYGELGDESSVVVTKSCLQKKNKETLGSAEEKEGVSVMPQDQQQRWQKQALGSWEWSTRGGVLCKRGEKERGMSCRSSNKSQGDLTCLRESYVRLLPLTNFYSFKLQVKDTAQSYRLLHL